MVKMLQNRRRPEYQTDAEAEAWDAEADVIAGRWGSARASPRMLSLAEQAPVVAPDERTGAPAQPEPHAPTVTLDSIHAWWAQRKAMQEKLAEEISATKSKLAELELMELELSRMGAP